MDVCVNHNDNYAMYKLWANMKSNMYSLSYKVEGTHKDKAHEIISNIKGGGNNNWSP